MAGRLLDEPKQEWIENLLNLWGAWAFSGLDQTKRMSMLAKLMQQADPNAIIMPAREVCDDELGLLISSVVGYYVKTPCPKDFKYLEAKYIYGCSVYAIAKYQWKRDKSIGLRAWQKRVTESLKASEWLVGKMLDIVLKNHKNVAKFKKFAFNV